MTINDQFDSERFPQRAGNFRSHIPDMISVREFYRLVYAGRVVDGRSGGVLLGKNADEGGARGIFKIGSHYLIQGCLSGGDFIMNKDASARHMKRLSAMNAGMTLREIVVDEPGQECGQLLVATAYPHDRLVWLDFGQIVIGREAAQKHLMELCRMNEILNPYYSLDLYKVFGCEPGTTDGVV